LINAQHFPKFTCSLFNNKARLLADEPYKLFYKKTYAFLSIMEAFNLILAYFIIYHIFNRHTPINRQQLENVFYQIIS